MAPGVALGVVSGVRRRLRILDPMAGSGTVLVAARTKGHYAIGLDLDPLAVLLSKVWCTSIDKAAIRKKAETILRRAEQSLQLTHDSYPRRADAETKRFIRYWFDPCARRQLASLAKLIGGCRNRSCQNVLWCAFSRMIITKQAGSSLAMDLAHSRPHKRFKRAPVKPFASFLRSVDRVLENCISSTDKKRGPAPRIKIGDARQLEIADDTIDLVVTSPPYLNAIDYLRCSKFSLVWMGSTIEELRVIRSSAIGTEVGDYLNLSGGVSGDLFRRLKLNNRLSRRDKAVISRFISDMYQAIHEVSRVLVPGGKAIYVMGENTIGGTYIQNAKIIRYLAELAGLKFKAEHRRRLPPNRRYLPPPSRRIARAAMNARMRREVILQFLKPKNRKPVLCRLIDSIS
jgi:DNA modification methylase